MATAIILAGGKGTRLRPMTDTTPKPLLRTPRKTILETQIQNLYDHGVHSVYILIHQSQHEPYKACIDTLDIQHYIRIVLVVELEWLGTAGAVVNCLWAHPELSHLTHILIMNGDIVCNYPFSSLISIYKASNCACLLTHFATKDASQYGLLRLSKEHKSLKVSSEALDKSSLSFSSQNTELLDSLSAGDRLQSSSSLVNSVESTDILSEELTDISAESESVTSSTSLVDTCQIMRIKDYDRIHRSSTRISRVSTPHLPSSPAGLRSKSYGTSWHSGDTGTKSKVKGRYGEGVDLTPLGSLQLDLSYGQLSLMDCSSRHLHSFSKQVTPRAATQSSSKTVTRLGKVLEFIEKPRFTAGESQQKDRQSVDNTGLCYANAGIYVINPSLLLSFPVPCSMEEKVFPTLLARKLNILSFYIGTEKTWSDMGTIAGFIRGCQLLNKVPTFDPASTSSMSKGTCHGNVVDDTSRISSKANVSNCVIYGGTTVPPGVYLDGCIVCSAERICPGKRYYNKIIY